MAGDRRITFRELPHRRAAARMPDIGRLCDDACGRFASVSAGWRALPIVSSMRFPALGHRAVHAVEFREFGGLPDTASRFVVPDPVIFTILYQPAAFLRDASAAGPGCWS